MTRTAVILQLPANATRVSVAAAASRGIDALLVPQPDAPAVDATVVAGALSAHAGGVPIIVEAHTGRHAPYNLARRVQTLARITGGRAGLYLRDTGVDAVTAASRPHVARTTSAIAEYARLLRLLWASFPESALIGDRDAGLLADVAQIAPARHEGDVYGVAGALNVPLDGAQRPVLIVDGGDAGADSSADAVIAGSGTPAGGAPVFGRVTWRVDPDGSGRLVGDVTEAGVLLRIDAPGDDVAEHLDAALAAVDVSPRAAHDPGVWDAIRFRSAAVA